MTNDHTRSTTSRREFLLRSGAVASVAAIPSVFARALAAAGPAEGDRVLVLLRLGGGNDGLNTVVPAEDDRYHRARPSLRIPLDQALPLGDGTFLHPSLPHLKDAFDDGRVAVVQGVGYPSPDRSHFRSTDIWHTARPDVEDRRVGWAARALDGDASDRLAARTIAVLDGEAPLALAGGTSPSPTIPSLDDARLSRADLGEVARAAAAAPASAPSLRHVRAATRTAVATADRLERAAADARSDAFPATRLGRRLATVNALLRADLGARVFYTALDGFDTHTRQAQNHAQLLRDLDRSVAAWSEDLRRTGDDARVMLVTFSEFGRRVAENASLGTDHGAAAPLFVVSGGLNPGVIGPPPDLDDLDDGDVRHAIDFRSVYATLLERWLGVPSEAGLGGRFPVLPFARG